MVRTFSTLFQTMMRCYSSLRAGRGHISSFPNPVQQVIPKDRRDLKVYETFWLKVDWDMGREQRAGNLLQNEMVTAGIIKKKKKEAELEVEKEIA